MVTVLTLMVWNVHGIPFIGASPKDVEVHIERVSPDMFFGQEIPAVLLYTQTYQYVVPAELQGLSPGLLLGLSSRFSDSFRWYMETGADQDVTRRE